MKTHKDISKNSLQYNLMDGQLFKADVTFKLINIYGHRHDCSGRKKNVYLTNSGRSTCTADS